jgi:hypothetical protein
MRMRQSKIVQAISAVLWVYVAYVGASWCWSGISIVVGNVAGACETIPLDLFGTGIGPQLGTCLAKASESSWGINGFLVGAFAIIVGSGILAALLMAPGALAKRRGLRTV